MDGKLGFNIFRDAKEGDIGELIKDIGVSNPILDTLTFFRSGRDGAPPTHPFFGKQIYNDLDPAPLKAAKVMEHLAFTFLPSALSPSQGALGYTWSAIVGAEDRWGKQITYPQALGRWFGVNMVAVSPEQTAAIASVKIQEMKKDLSRLEADPSISEERKEASRRRMNERLAKLAEESPTAVLPILKQKGDDPVFESLREMVREGILKSGPPSRNMEINGTPVVLSIEQYRRYLEESSELARTRLAAVIAGTGWEAMSDKRKAEIVSGIVSNARKGIRQRLKMEIIKENRDKITAGKRFLAGAGGG